MLPTQTIELMANCSLLQQ